MYHYLFLLIIFIVNPTACTTTASITTSGSLDGAGLGIQTLVYIKLSGLSGSSYAANDDIGTCTQQVYSSTETLLATASLSCVYTVVSGKMVVTFTSATIQSTANYLIITMGTFISPYSYGTTDSFKLVLSQSIILTISTGLTFTYASGALTSGSWSSTSTLAGSSGTLTLGFNFVTTLPAGALIEIQFPTSAYPIAPVLTVSQISVSVQGTTYSSTLELTYSSTDTSILYISGAFPSSLAATTTGVDIYITSFIMPSIIGTATSLTIATLNSTYQLYDSLSAGFTITTSGIGSITEFQFSTSSQVMGDTATITFSLVSGVQYLAGGYISVVVPSLVTIPTTPTCTYSTGFDTTATQTCINAGSQTVQISGTLDYSSYIKEFTIDLVNPYGSTSIPTFKVYYYNSDGTLIADLLSGLTYTTTAGSCTITSAIRSSTVRADSGVTYSITFECADAITSAGYIYLLIPIYQMVYSSGITCQSGSGTALTYSYLSDSSYSNFTIPQWCTTDGSECAAETSLEIQFLNAVNPSYSYPTSLVSSIQLYTLNPIGGNYYPVDYTTTGNVFTPSLATIPVTITSAIVDDTLGTTTRGYTTLGEETYFSLFLYGITALAYSTFTVTIPSQYTSYVTSGNTIAYCILFAYGSSDTQTSETCTYSTSTGSMVVTFSDIQVLSGLSYIQLNIGYFAVPSTYGVTDSFQVSMTGTYTASITTGLTLSYQPGAISFYTSTYDYSTTAGDTSYYLTFYFQITTNLPAGAYIQLYFPPSSWPAGAPTITSVSDSVYGTGYTMSFFYTSSNTSLLYLTGAFPNGLTAGSGYYIEIYLYYMVNPSIIGTTKAIAISTTTSSEFLIDTTYTGFTLTMTSAGTITFNSITPSTYEVDTTSSVTFSLTSTVQHLSGGYIEIVIPSQLSFPTTATCSVSTGFITADTPTCAYSGSSSIYVSGTLDYTSTTKIFSITVKNPLEVMTISTFEIFYHNSDASTIASVTSGMTYTTTPGSCYISSATRSSTIQGDTTDNTLTFYCDHRITETGYIQISVPAQQMVYSSSMSIETGAGETLFNTQTITSTYSTFMLAQWCTSTSTDCSAGSDLTIVFVGVTNPSIIVPSDLINSISITTYTTLSGVNYTVDTTATGLMFSTTLTPTTQTITSASATPISLNLGLSSAFQLEIYGVTELAYTYFTVTVPTQLASQYSSGSYIDDCYLEYVGLTSVNTTESLCLYTSSSGVHTVTFRDVQTVYSITSVIIQIGHFNNPWVYLTTDSFTVSISGTYTASFSTGMTITYQPGAIYNQEVTLSSSIAGGLDTIEFQFSIINAVPSGGFIQLYFPPASWPGGAPTQVASDLKTEIYGTTYTSLGIHYDSTNTSLLYITGSFPSTVSPVSGGLFYVWISNMYNPSLNGECEPVAITTTNSTYWVLDTTYTGYTFSLTGGGSIALTSISASNYIVDASTIVTFSLTSHVQYLSGGYMSIVYPQNFITVPTSITCSKSTGFKSTATATCTSNGTYSVILSCTLDYTSILKVFSISFVNPLGLATLPTFSVYYYNSDDTLLASITTGVSYTTTVYGKCYVTEAVRSSTIQGDTTTNTISFNCDHRIREVGYINLMIPTEQMVHSSAMTCQSSAGDDLGCVQALVGTTFVNITVAQWCTTDSTDCPTNTSMTINLVDATNPSIIVPTDLLTSIQIYTWNPIDGINQTVDEATTGIMFTNSLTSDLMTITGADASCYLVGLGNYTYFTVGLLGITEIAYTSFSLVIPLQLGSSYSSGSNIDYCSLIYVTATTTVSTTETCLYTVSSGDHIVSFRDVQVVYDITSLSIVLGYFNNPYAYGATTSFNITMTGTFNGTSINNAKLTYAPNPIFGYTATTSSNQSGSLSSYVLSFQVSTYLDIGSSLEFYFPLVDWPLAPTLTGSQISGVMQGRTVSSGITVSYSSYNTSILDIYGLFTTELIPDSTKYVVITFTDIVNPSLVSTTSAIAVTTYNSTGFVMDTSYTGVKLTMQSYGNITATSISPSSTEVDATVTVTFTLTSYVQYLPGGFIQIVGPTYYMTVPSTVSCGVVSGFSETTPTCTSNGTYSVYFSCALDYTITTKVFTVNYVNPLGVITIPTFDVYYYNSNNTIVGQVTDSLTYTTTYGTCYISNAYRSGYVLNAVTNYSMTFSCDHRIREVGYVYILIHSDQMAYSSSMTCQDTSGDSLGCVVQQSGNYTNVTLAQWCTSTSTDCPALTSLTIKFIKAVNPGYIVPTDQVTSTQLYILNPINGTNLTVDQTITQNNFTGDLIPGKITNLKVSRITVGSSSTSTSNMVGGFTKYYMTFTSATIIPLNGYISIFFPCRTVYTNNSITSLTCASSIGNQSCDFTTNSSDSSQIASVNWTNVCYSSGKCNGGTQFIVTVTGFLNPPNTATNTNLTYTIRTYSSGGYLVDNGTSNCSFLTLYPNYLQAVLSTPATPITVGSITTYTLKLYNNNNFVPASGHIIIVTPTEAPIQSSVCSAYTSSQTLTCSINSALTTVNVSNSAVIPLGSTITVTLSMKNPVSEKPSSAFVINSYYGTYSIDNSTTLKVTCDTPNSITNVVATRNNFQVNKAAQLTICFQTTNTIPANAYIQYYIPTDQAVYNTSEANITAKLLNGTSLTIVTQTALTSSTYIKIKQWCTYTSTCTSADSQCLVISGFYNPPTDVISTTSMNISTLTNTSYLIDSVSSGVIITPYITEGAEITATVTRTNETVGYNPTYTVTIVLSADRSLDSTNQIMVYFPDSLVFYNSSAGTLTCTIQNTGTGSPVSTACTVSTTIDANYMGYFISSVTANMECASLTCTGGSSFTFVLSGTGIFNAYNDGTAYEETIIVGTQYLVDGSYQPYDALDLEIGVDILFNNLSTNAITINSICKNTTTVYVDVSIQFNITLPTRLEKDGYIWVCVPVNQFVSTGSSYYYEYYSNSSYSSAQIATLVYSNSTTTCLEMVEWCSGTAYYCSEYTTLVFNITGGFKNAGSPYANVQYTMLQTVTSDGKSLVDQAYADESIYSSQNITSTVLILSTLTLSSKYVGMTGVYFKFNVVYSNALTSGTYVVLTFSDEFIRNDNGTVYCADVTIGTTNRTCVTNTTNGVITQITIYDICPSACTSTGTYKFKIYNVGNLIEQKAFTGTFKAVVYSSSDFELTEGSYDLSSLTTLSGNFLTGVSITRNTSFQGLAADYTFSFTTPGVLMKGSTIQLQLPLNQIIINPTYSVFKAAYGSTAITLSSATTSSTYNIVNASSWLCATLTCSTSQTFSLTITNAMNPLTSSTSYNDFVIKIFSSNSNLIYFTLPYLYATPSLSVGALTGVKITQPFIKKVSYTFTFTTVVAIPKSGLIVITFATGRLQKDSTSTLTCTANGKSVTTTSSWSGSTSSTEILIITVTSMCTSACSIGTYVIICSGGFKAGTGSGILTKSVTIDVTSSAGAVIMEGTGSVSVSL